jgi:GntR family transcriptional regulator
MSRPMTIIDPSSPTPLYEQLKFIIQDQILNGEYRQGSHLPSESTLCEKYGISRITVSRALNDLENDGILQRVQGSGTIVKSRMVNGQFDSAQGFSENMKMYGKKVTSKILSIDNIPADEAILKTFRLGSMEEESFIRFRRLRYVDGVPGAIMTSIVRSWVGTKMQDYDLEKASFYSLYQEITHLPVVRSETTLYPIVASPEISELLYVKQGSPHFLLLGTGFLEGDIPIEYSISVSNGSLFQFSTTLYKLRESNYAQYASKDLL